MAMDFLCALFFRCPLSPIVLFHSSLSLSFSLSFKHFSLQRIGALAIVRYTLYIYGRSYVTGLRLSVVCTLRNVLWLNGAP